MEASSASIGGRMANWAEESGIGASCIKAMAAARQLSVRLVDTLTSASLALLLSHSAVVNLGLLSQ